MEGYQSLSGLISFVPHETPDWDSACYDHTPANWVDTFTHYPEVMDTGVLPVVGNVQCEVDDVPLVLAFRSWQDNHTLKCRYGYGGPPPSKIEIKYIKTPPQIFCACGSQAPAYDWTVIPECP